LFSQRMKSIVLLCLVAFASAFNSTSPAQYVAWLSAPASEVSAAKGAIGACVIRYDDSTMMLGVLCHHNISSTDTVTASHIHGPVKNPAVDSGNVLIPLTVASQGPNSIYFTAASVSLWQACNISMAMTYINIHTTSAAGGLIRGAIMTSAASGVTHTATLDNLQAKVGTSITDTGVGFVKRVGTTIWVSLYHSLTILGPVGEHIHKVSDGSILYSICGLASSPFRNCTQLDTTVVNHGFTELSANVALMDGCGLYFNVHTAANPGGQIRGQVQLMVAATGPSNSKCTVSAGVAMQASFSLVALLAVALALFQ